MNQWQSLGLKKNNRMNSPTQSHTDEINLLLGKIDEYSQRASQLQTELSAEKKSRARLASRLEMIEKNKLSRTRQQTRIMRQQEEVVRDLSCELDQVSRKLKRSVQVGSSWEDKFKDLEERLREKERALADLRRRLAASEDRLRLLAAELREAQTIVELYEQLKLQSRNEEIRKERKHKTLYKKAEEIIKSYRDIHNEISRSEIKFKESLSKSAVLPAKLRSEDGGAKKAGEEEDLARQKKLLEKRINIFKTENFFLKRKVLNLLNQYCAEFTQDRSQASEIELSSYQKSLNQIPKKSVSALPINDHKKSITRLISSKRHHENENSLFKINTLKLSLTPSVAGKSHLRESGKLERSVEPRPRPRRDKSASRRKLEALRERQRARRGKSTKSDLAKSSKFSISCLEDSSLIGKNTFHVVMQRDLRQISKTSDNEAQFVSKFRGNCPPAPGLTAGQTTEITKKKNLPKLPQKKSFFSDRSLQNLGKFLEELQRLSEQAQHVGSGGKHEAFCAGVRNLLGLLKLNWVYNETSIKCSSVAVLDSKNNFSNKKTYFNSTRHQPLLFTVVKKAL